MSDYDVLSDDVSIVRDVKLRPVGKAHMLKPYTRSKMFAIREVSLRFIDGKLDSISVRGRRLTNTGLGMAETWPMWETSLDTMWLRELIQAAKAEYEYEATP